jgi:hypothetical protein
LSAPELRNLEQRWWMRYKFTPEAGECPSDYVVTTAARQLHSRRIMQPNLLQVKTLKTQKGSSTKRETVGETAGGKSLELVDREAMDEAELSENLENYILGMSLWAMSFAIAGNQAIDPLPTSPEGPESDSTDYVLVPWDVVEKWVTRAKSNAKRVPRDMQMAWVRNRTEADVRIWIDEFRLKTSLTLGKVIKSTYIQTANAWYYDDKDVEPQRGRTRRRSPSDKPRDRGRNQATGSGGASGKGSGGADRRRGDQRTDRNVELADQMRNGDRICREWNAGKCTPDEKDCPKRMKHCCSVLIKKNGRVCGLNNHRACEHKGKSLDDDKGGEGRRGRDRRH